MKTLQTLHWRNSLYRIGVRTGWMRWMAIASAWFLFASASSSPAADGEPIYHVGFEESEGYSLGPLLGQGEEAPNITPWLSPKHEERDGSEVVSASGGSHMPAPEGAQMLQIRYLTGNPEALQNFLPERKAIKQDFRVTFLLAADAPVSNGTFNFAIQSSSGLNSGAWFGIRKVEDAAYGFFQRKVDPDGKMVWERIGDGTFEAHAFHKVELDIHYGDMTYGGRVTNAAGEEVLKFDALPLLDHDGHMSGGRGFNRIYVGADQVGTKPYFLVDDITIALP